jgi:TonB family protein
MARQKAIIGYTGLSFALHTAFFMAISCLIIAPPAVKNPIKVSYQRTERPIIPLLPQGILAKPSKINNLPGFGTQKKQEPLWIEKGTIADLIKQDILKKTDAMVIARKPLGQENGPIPKKSVNLPNIPGETFKTPAYKSYYQIIREKIRSYAYYNYKKLEEGEVFLTFTLTSNGELKDVFINESKSAQSDYLRQTALSSVKQASPFPAFPEKLRNNKTLSFHVIVSFELK